MTPQRVGKEQNPMGTSACKGQMQQEDIGKRVSYLGNQGYRSF
jgi:hypothetical protein